MFRFHKTKDIITLFHAPSSPASIRVLTLLKTASATASEPATEDQASDHSHQSHPERVEFDLNVVEDAPTTDQLRSILDYVGGKNAGEVIRGARDEADAMKKLQENKGAFQRPLVVDWNNGKAVVGDKESEILAMVNAIPKDTA